MKFYLDDYNLIRLKESQKLLNKCLKVFCSQSEINFNLVDEGEYLSLILDYEYKEKDDLYVLLDNTRFEITLRFITLTKRFDEEYKCDVNSLGCFLQNDTTTFRLWVPIARKVYVVIDNQEYEMNGDGSGVYSYSVNKNLEYSLYHYKVIRDVVSTFSDPFSYVDKDNESYVLDINKFNKDVVIPSGNKQTVIYEINVRDFSSGDNLPFVNKKKILALAEEGLRLDGQKIGLDYLEELGISHVQIMPIFTYDYDGGNYNWGYNPINYNTIHDDYLVSEDPYEKINEVRTTFNKLHTKNIKVNLDVVFNHVYKPKQTSLDQMLPYYFFRYKKGKLGNGTYCGNETRSENYMFREYIKLMCKRYVELFDIDGLRFDLMGVLDYETINEISDVLKSIKNDFMVYGEGWNMGEVLPEANRASIENAHKMKDIAFFNDKFRINLRGNSFNDTKCFLFGNGQYKEEAKKVLSGSIDYGFDYGQSLNYVECHDNYTFFDKALSVSGINCKEVSKLAIGLTMISRGIPFIHSGQEFLRTKDNIDNSFNLPDSINKLDWYRKNDNLDVYNYLKDLIKIRNEHREFSDSNVIISYDDYYECLVFRLNALNIFINPCGYDHIYNSDDNFEVFYDENGFTNYETKAFKIRAFGLVFAYKR